MQCCMGLYAIDKFRIIVLPEALRTRVFPAHHPGSSSQLV